MSKAGYTKCFIPLCVFLITVPAFAGGDLEGAFLFPLDAATEPGFDSICSEFASHDYMRCNFKQIKTSVKTGRSIISSGEIIINNGKGMLIKTLSPAASSMFAGSDFVVLTNSSGRSKKIEAKGNESFFSVSGIFNSLFSKDTASLKQHYDIFFKQDENFWLIGIKMKNKTNHPLFTGVVLQGSQYIDTMLFNSTNGDTIKYILSDIHFPGVLTKNEMEYFEQSR